MFGSFQDSIRIVSDLILAACSRGAPCEEVGALQLALDKLMEAEELERFTFERHVERMLGEKLKERIAYDPRHEDVL